MDKLQTFYSKGLEFMTKKANEKETPKRKPNAPVIFSREMNDWLKNGGTNPHVNNNAVRGGQKPWNG